MLKVVRVRVCCKLINTSCIMLKVVRVRVCCKLINTSCIMLKVVRVQVCCKLIKGQSSLLYHFSFIVGLDFQYGIQARRYRVRVPVKHISLCIIISTYKKSYSRTYIT
jgi:hypothetical protein